MEKRKLNRIELCSVFVKSGKNTASSIVVSARL